MAEVEQVDRISNLPDALLSFILSFLSTKQAVATSILSKRWEFVWTKVPVLNFSVCYSDSANSFNAFVDRVLICNDTRSLRLFQLNCLLSTDVNALHYHSWIRNIMRRDIVEIDLDLGGGILPSETFSNEKLMVLKLTGFDSPLRNPFHLPNLLTLHFTYINFSDDFSLNDILMRLPRLEELIIKHCRGLQNICIHSSSLKRLNLNTDSRRNEITIVAAPSLEFLCIESFLSDYKFDNMPSLAEARLYIRRDYFYVIFNFVTDMRYEISVTKILQQVSNSMTLRLQVDTIEEAILGGTEHNQLPLFPRLNHLIASGYHCSIKCSNFSWRYLVLWILQRAPNLVSLDYSVRLDPLAGQSFEYECRCPPVFPTCLPKCRIPTLEVVNISFVNLADADKILLECLLNNAINLKMLKINLKGRVSETTIAAIAWLFNVPRASSVSKLVISHLQ